jgi:hypothetical protein
VSEHIYYALIDRYSGSLSWVGEARSPEEACTIGSAEADPSRGPRRFERVYSAGVDDGYDVYASPGEIFTDADGRDRTVIEEVRKHRYLGVYQATAPLDLADLGE